MRIKPTKPAVIRDTVLFVFGLSGIGYQTLTGQVDISLLLVFTAMTGVPGLTNLVSLLRGGSTTELPSPPPAASDSPSDSGNAPN